MKFDTKTLKILKNFNDINKSIYFRKGSVLSTISPTKTILAKATVVEEFDRDFAIYDLGKFLSVLSMFQEPEIELQQNQLVVSKDKNKVKYTYADPKNIVTPPDKQIKLPSVDIQFTLTQEMYSAVSKAMSVLSLPEMGVVGKDGVLKLQAMNSKDPSADTYEVELGDTDKNFEVLFKAENLKILPGTYQVSVSSKMISNFKSDEVEYFIAIEANSKFN